MPKQGADMASGISVFRAVTERYDDNLEEVSKTMRSWSWVFRIQ